MKMAWLCFVIGILFAIACVVCAWALVKGGYQ